MALKSYEVNGQEGGGRSTEPPDPTYKQVTPHTREAQSEDQPSSKIPRVKESAQQIYLIGVKILQLLYIYTLEDPDVVELLLMLLPQLWCFIKWSFVVVISILLRIVLYHVNHIRLSPFLSRFAKKIFCQQKSYSNLSVQETDNYIDISGRQTKKENNGDKANEEGEEPPRLTHTLVTHQAKPLGQTLSKIWGKVTKNFQLMYLGFRNILHPICRHFLQEEDVVYSLLLLILNLWRCFKWTGILILFTHIYVLFCCANTVLSVCSSLLGLRKKIFDRVKKPIQETGGDTSEDLDSVVIHQPASCI